jgi:hypothetical protein
MSIKARYKVKSIDSNQTYDWLLNKHYAKRIPSISYSFGLFDDQNLLIGICTFGFPPSSTLRLSFGEKFTMLELNRLCINDNHEKNAASFFVSQSLNLLPQPSIIVSYADTEQGHNGYIYQASNFIYTGLSAKRTDWKVKGLEHLHSATIADISRGKENRSDWMRKKYGDDFYLEERSRKHRYFYFIGNKNQKKEMIKMLPYDIKPYPKGENKNYDASYIPKVQLNLF